MANKVKPIPDGYHTVTPYLIINGAAAALEFYKKAFGATESLRMPGPNGKVGHAEIRIGDSIIMVSGAGARETMTAFLYVYVDDVDSTYQRALQAGATSLEEPWDVLYGDRRGMVRDHWGNTWQIATHKEDVSM